MMAESKLAIGIDLGGTNIKGVLIDGSGNVLNKATQATLDNNQEPGKTGQVWKKAIYDMVKKLKAGHQQNVQTIGLAAPGIPNELNDSIAYMPSRLQGLEQFKWTKFLNENDISISIINDAQAALVAESSFGSGQGFKHIVMLTLGTGVGGGIMINGDLYQGNYQRAGHFGHVSVNAEGGPGITGTPGSLEDAIGNESVFERSLGEYKSTQELVNAFNAGNHFAAYIWLNSIQRLSVGITSLINAFSPDLVILGGGITQAGEALFIPLKQFLNKYEWQPGVVKTPIKKAMFHQFSGAIGAGIFSLKNLLKE